MLHGFRSFSRIPLLKKAMASKTVAVIGAGPGGLVAAKTLLHSHPNKFQVTVFEKSDRLGGIWSVTSENQEGIIPLNMPTNLSQFAVSFSDLAWSSLDLPGGRAFMNPKAWQVNSYLEAYRRKYLPEGVFKFKTSVKSLQEDPKGGWKLVYTQPNSIQEQEKHFDFCILASGFYSKPQPIKCQLDGFDADNAPVKMVHSSLYRGLDDILPPSLNQGKKLLVVGGANSGGEVSAALAFDLSNARHSPKGGDLEYEIVHILPKPVYGIPLFVPSTNDRTAFVPLDVKFYDLSNRPDQPVSLKTGRHTDASKRMLHSILQGMLGNDFHEIGQQKLLDEEQGQLETPKAAIQDNWASYVRSGAIEVKLGRVLALHGHGPDGPLKATVQSSTDPNETTIIDGVAGVIYATGYSPKLALSILPPDVRKALSYDMDYPRMPILLPEDTLASNPAVPNLGFVGLYEGPYWGVMEMQARQLANRWANLPTTTISSDASTIKLSDRTQARMESLLDIRSALKDAPHLVPQYIFSDYLAIMEESARDLSLIRNDGPFNPKEGPITPSRYLDKLSDKSEADKTIASLSYILEASKTKGLFIPHVVFRGLQGKWKLHRNLRSARPEYPTGIFSGEAWFHPRKPTTSNPPSPQSSQTKLFDQEYLYSETGTLRTDSGLSIPTYKNYVWRLNEDPEKISVWFVKQDDGRSMDYLYHDLEFATARTLDAQGKVVCSAKSSHLCEKDMYVTAYTFVLNGVALDRFEVVHTVKGPNKDYVSTTAYSR